MTSLSLQSRNTGSVEPGVLQGQIGIRLVHAEADGPHEPAVKKT